MQDSDSPLLQLTDRDFQLFRGVIQRETGIWLRDGKNIMLASRLTRRMQQHGLSDFNDYYKRIERCTSSDPELIQFINCVTTNKTSFFRENHHFDYLASHIMPLAKRTGKPLAIWCAAASTGEEPYSIAMTVLESLAGLTGLRSEYDPASSPTSSEILASDVDTKVLDTARRGVYSLEALGAVPETMRRKYFLRGTGEQAGQCKVKSAVQSLVKFERLNLMESLWPVKAGLDVIFFRNALIYFQPEIQDRFLRRMGRMLKPGGYLFLGHSEHIPWLHDVFEPLNQTIYRLREAR